MGSSRLALSALFILSATASLAVYVSWHPYHTHAFDCSPRDRVAHDRYRQLRRSHVGPGCKLRWGRLR